jgi:hypothetical protein
MGEKLRIPVFRFGVNSSCYTFKFVGAQLQQLDENNRKRDRYKFISDDYIVYCDDASDGEAGPKHTLHIELRPRKRPNVPGLRDYRFEIYSKTDEETGEHMALMLRLCPVEDGLYRCDVGSYIGHMEKAQNAMLAMSWHFDRTWPETKYRCDKALKSWGEVPGGFLV